MDTNNNVANKFRALLAPQQTAPPSTKPKRKAGPGRPKGSKDKNQKRSNAARAATRRRNKALSAPNAPKVITFPVPEQIHQTRTDISLYSPQVVTAILSEVATTPKAVHKITESYKIDSGIFYGWLLDSEDLSAQYSRALEARAYVEAESAQQAITDLEGYINDPDVDAREKHVRTNFMRVKLSHLQWRLERHNRKQYGAQLQVDANVTVSAGEARNKAWELMQEAKEVPYTPAD